MVFRTIDAAFWTDPKVRSLGTDSKLLFLYLITNPHTHASGIYYLPKSMMAHETGIKIEGIDRVLDTLSGKADLVRFDGNNEIIWVVRMLRYQARGEKNRVSAAYHIVEDCHKSPLIKQFIEMYRDVGTIVSERFPGYRIDTHSMGSPDLPLLILNPDPSIPIPTINVFGAVEPSNGKHPKQSNTKKPRLEPAPEPGKGPTWFEELWARYPVSGRQRSSRAKCWTVWKRDNLEAQGVHICDVLEGYLESTQWLKEDGQYVPAADRWLREKKYLESATQ